ncbi:hypothetical protein LY13_005088 [Prauserella aidingensis]|uniref:hypothetical protein n=1 Tax=Prauserella aidingensis TaxID=387890 RepID=UPI0020A3F5FA|nr:hypothetical protein [Prauserella aidingensis]MCP2256297.1 hypothetical protein [Prauserella aidingensis]
MSEVWLETRSGLVRTDAIVSVHVEKRRLVVCLGVPTGGEGGGRGWDLGPTEHVVCTVLPETERPARTLIGYIAEVRGRGEAGVVAVSDGGVPMLEPFD